MELTRPKIILLAIVFGIFFIADVWLEGWKEDQANLRDDWNLEAGVVWNEQEVAADMMAFEQALVDAEYALRAKEYVEAEKTYRDGLNRVAKWRDGFGERSLAGGTKLRSQIEAAQKVFNEGPRATAMEKLVYRFMRGEGRKRELDLLMHRFGGKRYDIERIYVDRQQDVSQARSELAGNWVRVVVMAPPDFDVPIEEGIVRHWNGRSGRELVLGHALSPAERNHTLKTLYANVEVDFATFVSDTGEDQYQLPEGLVITFETKNGPDALVQVNSSWDDLPAVKVEGDFATAYNVELDYEGQGVDFSEEISERREKLLRQAVLELHKLPEYQEITNTSM